MKEIDYEAIAREAAKTDGLGPTTGYVKAIIDAYEAQKTQPEWVPLDLATVKQGQEVRHGAWQSDCSAEFACLFKGGFIWAINSSILNISANSDDWLMRAPKPKTVKVKVYRHVDDFTRYMALLSDLEPGNLQAWKPAGEGEIEVRE